MAEACPSPESVFILCDISRQGFPIQYISPGFAELFEYSQAECIGKACGDLIGGQSVKTDEQSLAHAAEVSGMSRDEAAASLDVLTAYAGEQCRPMFAKERFGFTLVLNRKKSGAIFVCELLMLVLKRADLGWSFAIGMQRDVTQAVPVGVLLKATACGELQRLVDESKAGVASRLAKLGISSDGVAQHVHDNAVERTQSMRPSTSDGLKPGASRKSTLGLQAPSWNSGGGWAPERGGSRSTRAQRNSKAPGGSSAGRLGQIPESCAEESSACASPMLAPPPGLPSPQISSSWESSSPKCAGSALGTAVPARGVCAAVSGLADSPPGLGEPAYVRKPFLLGRRQAGWNCAKPK